MSLENHANRPPLEEIEQANRRRLKRDWALSPQQRLARFEQLQALANQTLRSHPVALQAFVRRNHHARRHSHARHLEQLMLCTKEAKTN
jgi:hypothetical protein